MSAECIETAYLCGNAFTIVYATAGIPEYWIFNLVDNVLEVFLDSSNGEYKTKRISTALDSIEPLFQKDISLVLSDFLL